MAERNFSGIQRRRGGCQRELSGEDTKLELEDCSGVKYTMDSLEESTCWGVGSVPQLYEKQSCKAEATVTCCGDFSHSAVLTAVCLLLPGRAHLRSSLQTLLTCPTNTRSHPCAGDESGFPPLSTYQSCLRSG